MKILILLATYNGENFINEQLLSILGQVEVDVEIYIFDDCSNDNTLNVINLINDERIFIHKNNTPSGSAGLNFLNAVKTINNVKLESFDYVAFSDQDDIWYPNKLFEAFKLLNEKNSDLYCSNLLLWDSKNNIKKILKKDYNQKKFDYLFEGASAGCTYLLTNNLFVSFKQFLNTNKFPLWNDVSHDWLIYFYSRLNGFNVIIDSVPRIIYRIHQNNVHGQLNTNTFKTYLLRFKLVIDGWYFKHINNLIELTPLESEARNIYNLYSKNWFTRTFVICKYNFSLIRNNKKFVQFALLSLIPRFNNKQI